MSDDRLNAERIPDGGIRIQGAGIDLRVSREAIERAEKEGGLGFNYAETPYGHERLPPVGMESDDSPIDSIMHFTVQARPQDPEDTDD